MPNSLMLLLPRSCRQVYELFDNLCLLSAGEVVYFGAACEALGMYNTAGLPCPNNRNPSDHFLHVRACV